MPGKANPVIPEAVSQVALRVQANHQLIMSAASLGNLELNAFLPLLADALLESIALLTSATGKMATHCVEGLSFCRENLHRHVDTSTATATALVSLIGYEKAASLLAQARESGQSLRTLAQTTGLLDAEAYDDAIRPETVTRLGSAPEPDHATNP